MFDWCCRVRPRAHHASSMQVSKWSCLPQWTRDFCLNSIHSITESVGIAIDVVILVLVILPGLVYACRRKPSFVETLRNSVPSMLSLPSMPRFPSVPGFRSPMDRTVLQTLEMRHLKNQKQKTVSRRSTTLELHSERLQDEPDRLIPPRSCWPSALGRRSSTKA
ncbi:unnamed protein product [Arctogadus glacialis]